MTTPLQELLNTIRSGLVSRSLNTCGRWATHRRIMGGDFSGPYSFKHHPWCKGISDSTATYNTTMKAAQMGVTEVAINLALFTIDILKRDVLYVLPTTGTAGDFSKSRFNTALHHSEYLQNIFTNTNSVGLKQAGGVNLYIRGSRSDNGLKSVPVSVLILDELDEMDQRAIWLALERLSGQLSKTVHSLSTPTIPDFGIHKLYEQGTQEHFFFNCPHCGKKTELVFPECLKICGEHISDPKVSESYIRCKECKKELKQAAKPDYLKNAFWEATNRASKDHRSFYINQLYSFTINASELAEAYFRGIGDEAALVEYYNSKQGKPYVPDGGQITDAELQDATRNYVKADQRPEHGSSSLITLGIDQGKWNHACVVEYTQTHRGLDVNDTTEAKVLWEGKLPGSDFNAIGPLMREWQVKMCVIDADPQINDARRFARKFPGYVYLCRYRKGQSGKELQVSEEDDGAPIATVDRTNWLDASLGRFHTGRIMLPADTSLEFKTNIKALIRTYEKDKQGNPKAVYKNTGPDHFGHALNYAEIALKLAHAHATGADITGKIL